MDGTLINTEDLYTEGATTLLKQYGKGPMTWDVKIQLQGRPGPEAIAILLKEYDIEESPEVWQQKANEVQDKLWNKAAFVPGGLELIKYLVEKKIPIALGTSSNTHSFKRKTKHLKEFEYFKQHIVTGDDKRIPKGKGKPAPDIWYACLESINEERRESSLPDIQIEECLIFEDGLPGVESGINAGSTVIWTPHPEALPVLNGRENDIIKDHGEILTGLDKFDPSKYGL